MFEDLAAELENITVDVDTTCPACAGDGTVEDDQQCARCGGSGEVADQVVSPETIQETLAAIDDAFGRLV